MVTVPIHKPSTVLLSAQTAMMKQLELRALNLANASVPAFQSLLHPPQTAVQTSSLSTPVSYVKQGEMRRNINQGAIHSTGNMLDIAIMGQGYFPVEGGKYTRNGRFQMDQQGRLLTVQGDAIVNNAGSAITLPTTATQIFIAKDGSISTEKGPTGQKIDVVVFENEQKMVYRGLGYFTSESPPVPSKNTSVLQHSYEESNVEPFTEVTKLIELQRAHEHLCTLTDTDDEQKKKLISLSPQR